MKNEEYYNKIKGLVYKRFDALNVIARKNENPIYVSKKVNTFCVIIILKEEGTVHYDHNFMYKYCKHILLQKIDFEIFLKMWVEDRFKIKVNKVISGFKSF